MEQAEQQAFLALIEQNKGIIFKICNSYCKDRADREDLAQEIIYQLWKSGNRFNTDYKFTTWMYRVALNTAISHYRKEKKTAELISIDDHPLEIEDSVDTGHETQVQIAQLNQFIDQLKELDKALLLLYLEEKSHAEIAEIIGISVSNVSTRINRIKTTLKQNFSAINK